MTRRTALLCGIALSACMGACEPFGPIVCTDIGCVNGLTVSFDSTLPEGAIVTLNTGGTPLTVTCASPTVVCGDRLHFEGLRADFVVVRVETGGAAVEQSFRPEYSTSRPNGDDCPPECFHAAVEMALPAALGSGTRRGTGAVEGPALP